MKKLEWENQYNVGIKEIDDQHKSFLQMINEMVGMVSQNNSKEKVAKTIQALLDYKKIHFETEEMYFKKFNYEGTEEHIREHQKLGEKLEKIIEENENNISSLLFTLIDFLEDWLVNHLRDFDQKYKECFINHGLV